MDVYLYKFVVALKCLMMLYDALVLVQTDRDFESSSLI